ncbi:MAG: hypothetical protein BWY81_00995 [Firmicutes bacterium ADurb.Bin467]|nr:MAG: hypothetical protein BWY81_00995 [Firmicutes bacterium ADurb.Bin467]
MVAFASAGSSAVASCTRSPTPTDPRPFDSDSRTAVGAGKTVTAHEDSCPLKVLTVTSAVPTETAVTLPVFKSTFAISGLSEVNSHAPALPGVSAALSVAPSPTPSASSARSSDTPSGAGSTVSVAVFFFQLYVQTAMVDLPGATARTALPSMTALPGFDDSNQQPPAVPLGSAAPSAMTSPTPSVKRSARSDTERGAFLTVIFRLALTLLCAIA